MKTTLDLPDELLRDLALRASRDGRTLDEVIAALLRAGLPFEQRNGSKAELLVSKHLPLIKVRPADPPNASKLSVQEWCEWLKNTQHRIET